MLKKKMSLPLLELKDIHQTMKNSPRPEVHKLYQYSRSTVCVWIHEWVFSHLLNHCSCSIWREYVCAYILRLLCVYNVDGLTCSKIQNRM